MNKEIEEMSAYLSQFTPILSENNCHRVAEQAYKDGYRRESEDITNKNFKSNNSEDMSNTQIEELATEIYTLFRSRPMSRALARRLYDKGWRKQKEGEWVYKFSLDGDKFYECSVCGRQEVVNRLCTKINIAEDRPYCHCGAKMKGGE